MNEFNGTPGPWRLVRGYGAHQAFVLAEGEDEGVADVFGSDDARLIAAAPELLEAAFAALRYDNGILGRAANGEVDLLKDGGGVATGADLDALYADWQTKSRAAIKKALGS